MAETKHNVQLVISATAAASFQQLGAKMRKLTMPFEKFGKGFSNLGGGLGRVGNEALALTGKLAAVGGVAAFAFANVLKGTVEAGDKLGEMADRTGLSVDAFASLQHAAGQADIEQEQFNSGMDTFNKNVGLARLGTGKFFTMLQKIGPAFAQQIKGAKSTEEAFSLLTDAMERHKDPSDRAALSVAAFGDAAFGGFLGQGGAAIQAQQAESMRLGGSQEQLARNAGLLDNALKKLAKAFGGLRTAGLAPLMPAFTKLAEAVTDFVVKNRDGIAKWAEGAGKAIKDWLAGGGLERLVENFKELGRMFAPLIEKVGAFRLVAIALGAYLGGPLLMSIAALAPMFASLAATLAPFVLAAGPFLGMLLALGWAGKVLWDNWEPLKAAFADLWESITWEFGKAWETIRPIMDKISDFMGLTAGGLKVYKTGAEAYQHAPERVANRSAMNPGRLVPVVSQSSSTTEARVTIDVNAPKGTLVTKDKGSTAPLDLNANYGPIMSGF